MGKAFEERFGGILLWRKHTPVSRAEWGGTPGKATGGAWAIARTKYDNCRGIFECVGQFVATHSRLTLVGLVVV